MRADHGVSFRFMPFVRLFVSLVLIEAGAIRLVWSNPILLQCGEPVALIAEDVQIAVEENQSIVSGSYTFRELDDGCPRIQDMSDTVKIPIIVQNRGSFASFKSLTAVSLTRGGRVFPPARASVDPPLYDLPSGWKLYYFEFDLPRRPVRSVFTLAVRYVQPHLPGNLAPYYPIHPPERWAPKSVVRYSVGAPASLALFSKGETVAETQPTRISVRPQHHKLILVRVIRPDPTKQKIPSARNRRS
jgi:hypothetical protein